ncbi:MAG: signal peptidase I [Candidatus Magasanikbacteria bacterium RIFOXYA2_FULL_44_8]|uniref:Signal peptidase I n=1 Tax=Candidatus Magasanikbacteria bacterium RIFOXYA2_FULL_44_8 TaxID=1798696 RepID=A0A1F6NIN5_9BACT|nr:MAG: signal peptidase I [Candidatus Magasanikbacteria bacterium RIFOXYA2_FULL_44_8]
MSDTKFSWSDARKKLMRALVSTGLFLLELIKVSILAGITIGLVRYYLFKPFYVKGASMEPNFYENEYLIIDELSYRFNEPKRGDVIVFKYPENPKEYFLKRIIGLPGERVKISEGRVIVYNDTHPEGFEISEAYLPKDLLTAGDKITALGPHEYYVLGDNRQNSHDSRRFGPVDRSLVVGRAWFRGWPVGRMQTFDTPNLGI